MWLAAVALMMLSGMVYFSQQEEPHPRAEAFKLASHVASFAAAVTTLGMFGAYALTRWTRYGVWVVAAAGVGLLVVIAVLPRKAKSKDAHQQGQQGRQ